MTRITVNITKEVLEASANCTKTMFIGQNCAIGKAIHDLIPNSSVGRMDVVWHPKNIDIIKLLSKSNWTGNENIIHIPLPVEASIFIIRFDNLMPAERVQMTPFSFDIELPDEIINEINIDEVKRILEHHPTLSFATPSVFASS